MARLPRLVLPGQLHLIVLRARTDAPAVVDAADAQCLRDALQQASRDEGVRVHAYSVTETELRLLATPSTREALARLMQSLSRRYVRHFNRRHGRRGTPWDGRFRSTVVDAGVAFLRALRVVEHSTQGQAVEDEHDGPVHCSSLAQHLGGPPDALIHEHPGYWGLGNTPFEREAAYRKSLTEALSPADRIQVLEAATKGWVLGSTAFATSVADACGRPTRPRPRGRPRRIEISDLTLNKQQI